MAMELAQVPKMLMLLRHLWAPMAFCVSFKVFSYFLISALWNMTAYKSPAGGLLEFISNFQIFLVLQSMWIAVEFTVLTILKWRFLCNILIIVLYGGPHGWMGEAHMTTSCISSIWNSGECAHDVVFTYSGHCPVHVQSMSSPSSQTWEWPAIIGYYIRILTSTFQSLGIKVQYLWKIIWSLDQLILGGFSFLW